MIETHVVNALLKSSIRDEQFFTILSFINGLVAPSFLFCAGFAFAIAAHRRWHEYISFKRPLWRYLIRLLFILVIGYTLHTPIFSLRQLIALTDEQLWMPFFQSDIPHVIAVTLMFLVLFVVCVRNKIRFIQLSTLIAIVIVFFSPIVREMDHSNLPMWFQPYLTTQFHSQFPLFPWSAFLIAGTVIGYLFLKARGEGKEKLLVNRLLIVSVGAIVLSIFIELVPITVYPNHNFWHESPEFFFVRLGLVVLCCVGLWSYEHRYQALQFSIASSGRSVFTLFGQESLLVYVVHLLIVYGHTYEWSFIRQFGPTLGYLQCFGLFLALSAGMYLLAYAWHWVKGWNKQVAGVIQAATLTGIVVLFIVK